MMCLLVCNAAANHQYKQAFYKLKHAILEKHGHVDGYDKQTIVHKCWTCKGTGKWNGQTCNRCFNGIYRVNIYILKRYRMNDHIFHVPVEERPVKFKNEIEGLVQHKAFPGNFIFCYATLLWLYDRNEFFSFLGNYGRLLKTRAKHKWNIVMYRCKTPLHGLYNFFDVPLDKNKVVQEDDLPF